MVAITVIACHANLFGVLIDFVSNIFTFERFHTNWHGKTKNDPPDKTDQNDQEAFVDMRPNSTNELRYH